MATPFNVVLFGFGSIGMQITEAIIQRTNLNLVAVIDINPSLKNQYVEQILAIESGTKTPICSSLSEALAVADDRHPDAALIATSSSLENVAPVILECLDAGMDVVSICEELSFPYEKHSELSREIENRAIETGKTVLGTGINPGYLMDTLPILLTAPVKQLHSITVTRVINSSKRRSSFQKKIGTGMAVEEFRKAISSGTITGHVGLVQSIEMIDDALHLGLDEVRELLPEPITANRKIKTPIATVQPGNVLGLKSVGVGRRNGKEIVTLNFLAYAEAEEEYDEVRINGEPTLVQRISGGVHGDKGTVAMILNMVPLVITGEPGLLTMKDLPCPRNTQNYWKEEQ